MSDAHDQEPTPIVSEAHAIGATTPVNGTGRPTQAQAEMAQIALYGECRRRSKLAGRPLCHDWHPAGLPVQTPQSLVITRICCYCAPEGVTILVRTTLSEQQIQAEALRHGHRLVFEQVVQRGSGLVLPGQEGYVVPPGAG
jgi:hypothetical protein